MSGELFLRVIELFARPARNAQLCLLQCRRYEAPFLQRA
jgi:hypothetical protein